MQVAIDPADRKLLIVAGGIFLALLCAVAFFTPRAGEAGTIPASTYSSAPSGARAAFLLLQDEHFDVRRWENPLAELPANLSNVVLIFADPIDSPDSRDQAALERFVRNGGRVLITGSSVEQFFAGAKLLPRSSREQEVRYAARDTGVFTREAPAVSLQPEGLWQQVGEDESALYGDAPHPAMVSWQIGAGQVLWWAGSTPLTNSGILREGNLNVFLNAVGAPLDGSVKRPVIYWDEYYHGERSSLLAYANNTPLPWGIVQLIVLAAAILLTFGRRSGPLVAAFNEQRLWPLEFVDTLGGLYERAGAVTAAVGVVYRHFRSALVHRFRIPLTASDAAVTQAVEARLGWNVSNLANTLRDAAESEQTRRLKPSEGLAVIQELEYLEAKLGLKTSNPPGRT